MRNIILICVFLTLACPCIARTITVDDDGPADFNNIQAAINDANDGDTVLVKDGTYTGEGNRDIDSLGKAITVKSENGPENCIIDCNGTHDEPHRGFFFDNGEGVSSILDGLTITNGHSAEEGGGIYCKGGSPTITNCTISENHARNGGGIYCRDSSPTIANCTISENSARHGSGGGIFCHGDEGIIENCSFTGNSAEFGGGLHSDGTRDFMSLMTIDNCTFMDNSANIAGGGISLDGGGRLEIVDSVISYNYSKRGGGGLYGWIGNTLKMTNSTISHNITDEDGGGIWWAGRKMRIDKCTIKANKALRRSDYEPFGGGGLFFSPYNFRRAVITNSEITGNSTAASGGGIFGNSVRLIIINCILSGNSAVYSGGGIGVGESGRISAIVNTTVADNQAKFEGGGVFGAYLFTTIANSVFWGNADSSGNGLPAQLLSYETNRYLDITFSCIQDDNPDDANVPFGTDPNFNIDDDPCFVMRGFWADANDTNIPLEPNDPNAVWVEGDYHLLRNSPCVEAGNSKLLPPAKSITIEIDGQPRIIGQQVDMGADEFELPVIIVNSPKEGDVWVGNSFHDVNWYSYAIPGTVDISYSDNNGSAWKLIERSLPNTGSYTWHIPRSVDSNQCLVSVVPTIPDANVISINGGPFTIHPDLLHHEVPVEWQSLGGDFDRAGLSDNTGPEAGCVKWQFETGGPVVSTVTVGADDRTHIACRDGKLYTLDSEGEVVWTLDVNSPFLSAPTVGLDGSVYVGTEDGVLYAVSIAGNIRWTYHAGGFVWSSPAVSPDGTVYVGSGDGRLHALAGDGSLLWTFETKAFDACAESPIFASPAIGPDGTVYIGSFYDPNLYALNPNDGTVKWVCNFEHTIQILDWLRSWPYWEPQDVNVAGLPFASPVVAPDGTIYQGLLFDTYLYAIEPDTGTVKWSTDLAGLILWYYHPPDGYILWYSGGDPPEYVEVYGEQHEVGFIEPLRYTYCWSTPALGPDGTIYVSFNEDPYLRAVDPNGTTKWMTKLGSVGGFTLTVGTDGLIYAASDDNNLYVVNPAGEQIARFSADAPLRYPVIADNGKIIITDANNTVWQIGTYDCNGQPAALHRVEDLDSNWIVNNIDFAIMAFHWIECIEIIDPWEWDIYPPTCLQSDINGDLVVNWLDLQLLANRWLNSDYKTLAQVKLTPQMLRCDSHGKWLKAHVTLPEEIYPEDIDVNTPAVAQPPGVESEFIEVNEYSDGSFDVQIYFDRQTFCDALSESEHGLLEVTVTGSFIDGRKFQGSDTIRVIDKRHLRRGLVNSNSIVKDGIEYYIQADKAVYNLGENVQMLYRVTNLGGEDVNLGEVVSDPLNYYKFRVMQGNNQIWEYYHMTPIPAFHQFHLNPYESREFQSIWNMVSDNGTPWLPDDDFLISQGLYNVSGELDLISGERVPVSVQIEIIPGKKKRQS